MEKVLMLSSVASMIDQFNMPNIEILQNLGYEVHVAANFIKGNTCDELRINEFQNELDQRNIKYYQVDFKRKVTQIISFVKNVQQIVNLIKTNKYKFIHCHSPIGGVCGRVAGHITDTPVIYTAHGFHFYKGSPIKNWILYYTIEKICANYTNILITINQEDYELALKKFKPGKVEYIPGIGVDIKRIDNILENREQLRRSLGVDSDSLMILSIGELIPRKNHEIVLKALNALSNKNIIYIICGIGPLINSLMKQAKDLNLENQVKFLGYRKDIFEICKASDIFVFPSFQEGLSVALMEAMVCGLPVICSDIRGNRELIKSNMGGYLFRPNDIKSLVKYLVNLNNNKDLCKKMGNYNRQQISRFDLEAINNRMEFIYKTI